MTQTTATRALILVDDTPIRTGVATEFKKLYKTYTRHVAEIEHHESSVRPAYYRWLMTEFGDRIRRMQELHADLERLALLLQQERARHLYGLDEIELEDPFALDEKAFDEEESSDDDDDDRASSFGSRSDFDDESGAEEPYARFRGFRSDGADFARRSRSEARAPEERSRESQVKYYYRKLAQALHPDLSGEESELTREFWEDTQSAYKSGDLEQLKSIWSLVAVQTDALSREVRLFDLRAAVGHILKKLRLVKSQKRELKREDPAWGFEKKNKTQLAIKVRDELRNEERALANAVREVESDLRIYVKNPRQKSRGRATAQSSV